jgi:hypothetical protein
VNNNEFSVIANFEAEGSMDPSHIFTILLKKFDVLSSETELRSVLNYLAANASNDPTVQTILLNTNRSLEVLHKGDEIFESRNEPDMPDDLRSNLNIVLNCMVSDAIKAVRLAKEVMDARLADSSTNRKMLQ